MDDVCPSYSALDESQGRFTVNSQLLSEIIPKDTLALLRTVAQEPLDLQNVYLSVSQFIPYNMLLSFRVSFASVGVEAFHIPSLVS